MTVSNNNIICSAGTPLAPLIKLAEKHHLSGLEFAAGVPATIGGMVFMNFECWGIEVNQFVTKVLTYSKRNGVRWINRSEYQTGYRWTSFHDNNEIILAVSLSLNEESPDKIKSKMVDYLNQRKQKQPIMNATFGSVFKNPQPKKAGQLIDELGLKGHAIGQATVSEKHANFFENQNNASFKDTLELINLIQNKVNTMYNIKLECEVQILD